MQVLKWCFIYVFLLSTLANGSLKYAYESLQWGKRLVGRLLTNIVQVSPLDCAEEYLVRPGCLSFNYRRAAIFCELNYENDSSSDTRLTNEDGWIFGRREAWPMEITEECQHKRCQINEKCVLKALHIADCEIAHCHPSNLTLPKNVRKFSSDIALDLGSKHKMSCSDGYNQTGDGIVRCLRTGNWSDVNIMCNDLSALSHKCHLLNLSLPENVKNFTSNIAADSGTKLNLSCIDGYNQIGDGMVECLRNGTWSDYNITCQKLLQKCFYKYQNHTVPRRYNDSQENCRMQEGYLLEINSNEEFQFILNKYKGNNFLTWIGGKHIPGGSFLKWQHSQLEIADENSLELLIDPFNFDTEPVNVGGIRCFFLTSQKIKYKKCSEILNAQNLCEFDKCQKD